MLSHLAVRTMINAFFATTALVLAPARAESADKQPVAPVPDFASGNSVTMQLPDGPDWFQRCSGIDALADVNHAISKGMLLRLQEDRIDGTDLLTLRYALDSNGVFRTFIGAGLGRTEYYAEDLRSSEIPLSLRGKRTALGAAAELGGEWSVGEQVRVNASARWADIADEARALRTDHGPVVAQPLVLALSVGYRFR